MHSVTAAPEATPVNARTREPVVFRKVTAYPLKHPQIKPPVIFSITKTLKIGLTGCSEVGAKRHYFRLAGRVGRWHRHQPLDYYQPNLSYTDPNDRFSMVSFVCGPGPQTPIWGHTILERRQLSSTANCVLIVENVLAPYVVADLKKQVRGVVFVPASDNDTRGAVGLGLETGASRIDTPTIDRYLRPYEGTDVSDEAM